MHCSRILARFLVVFVMATAIMLAPVPAFAETKIGVVNIQKIMSDSKVAKSIQGQLDKQRKSFQEEFSRHERDLMEKEKQLVEQRAELPAEEFAVKKQEFENQLLETRKLVQKRQRALEQAAAEALNEVRTEVLQIVADISDAEGYDLIVTRQNVILSQKDLDITDSVMSRLDKTLKEVELKVDTN